MIMNSRGSAFILATMFTLLSLFAVALIQRQLGLMSAQAPAPSIEAQQSAGIGEAFVLLGTGLPPSNDYTCNLVLTGWFPTAPAVTLNFQLQESPQWQIGVVTQSQSFPNCPATFGSS